MTMWNIKYENEVLFVDLDDHDIIYVYNLRKSKIQYLKGLAYIVEKFNIYDGFCCCRDFYCDHDVIILVWFGFF